MFEQAIACNSKFLCSQTCFGIGHCPRISSANSMYIQTPEFDLKPISISCLIWYWILIQFLAAEFWHPNGALRWSDWTHVVRPALDKAICAILVCEFVYQELLNWSFCSLTPSFCRHYLLCMEKGSARLTMSDWHKVTNEVVWLGLHVVSFGLTKCKVVLDRHAWFLARGV